MYETQNENNVSVAAQIREYKQLYDDGIITSEEFELKKKQLLGLTEPDIKESGKNTTADNESGINYSDYIPVAPIDNTASNNVSAVNKKKSIGWFWLIFVMIAVPLLLMGGLLFSLSTANVSSDSQSTYSNKVLEKIAPVLEDIGFDTYYIDDLERTSDWAEGARYTFDYGFKTFVVYLDRYGKLESVNCNGKKYYDNGQVLIYVR